MATNFPTSIDALVNPIATDSLATVNHAEQHANANDAIEALEAKVGVTNSAVTSSLDYRVRNIVATTMSVDGPGTATISGSSTVGAQSDVAGRFSTSGGAAGLLVGSIGGTAPFVGTGASYPLSLNTNGVARLEISAGGRVGIGATLTSGAMVQVVNTTTGDKAFVVKGALAQSGNYFEIQNSSGNTLTALSSSGIFFCGGNTSTSYGVGYGASGSGFGSASIFQANISSAFSAVAGGTLWNNSTASAVLAIGKSRGATTGDFTIVQDNDGLGAISIGGADGARILQAARINVVVDGVPALDVMPGAITFQTNAGGTTVAERMRISATGLVGIGTTAPTSKLHVVGSFSRGAPVTKTASFTLADTENWIICNGTASITVTLPAASTQVGREISLKNTAAFTVVSATASSIVPLAGGTAGTAILPATAGAWATLVSNGTSWVIMQSS